jgi:hypothetical protein
MSILILHILRKIICWKNFGRIYFSTFFAINLVKLNQIKQYTKNITSKSQTTELFSRPKPTVLEVITALVSDKIALTVPLKYRSSREVFVTSCGWTIVFNLFRVFTNFQVTLGRMKFCGNLVPLRKMLHKRKKLY